MGHQEIDSVLHQFFVSYYSRPFKMLDLSCGDASFSAPAFIGRGRAAALLQSGTAARNDNLDIAWLCDTSNAPEDELTEPEEIASAIGTHLGNARQEIEKVRQKFNSGGETLAVIAFSQPLITAPSAVGAS